MKKSLLVSMLAISLTACSPSVDLNDGDFKLPDDLSHCRVVTLDGGNALDTKRMYLIRCPEGYIGTSFKYSNGDVPAHGSVTFD